MYIYFIVTVKIEVKLYVRIFNHNRQPLVHLCTATSSYLFSKGNHRMPQIPNISLGEQNEIRI